jgi:hypothetical protein
MKFAYSLWIGAGLLILSTRASLPAGAVEPKKNEAKKTAAASNKAEEELTREEFDLLMDELEMIEDFEVVRHVDALADLEIARKLPKADTHPQSKAGKGAK